MTAMVTPFDLDALDDELADRDADLTDVHALERLGLGERSSQTTPSELDGIT